MKDGTPILAWDYDIAKGEFHMGAVFRDCTNVLTSAVSAFAQIPVLEALAIAGSADEHQRLHLDQVYAELRHETVQQEIQQQQQQRSIGHC